MAILLRNRLKYEYSVIIYAPLCRPKPVRLTFFCETLCVPRLVEHTFLFKESKLCISSTTVKKSSIKKSSIEKLLHIVNDYEGVLKPLLESFVWENDEIQFIIWKAICFFKFAFVQIWHKLYTYYINLDIYDDGHVTLTSKTGRVVQTVHVSNRSFGT